MEEICPKDKCTACTACYSICPHGAIEMKENENGFLFPFIDNAKCVDCGACVKTCPVINPIKLNHPFESLAGYSSDIDDRNSSASGGLASVFTDYILSQGGVVYGSVQENVLNISHQRISKREDAYKLKGSKYVHSYLNNCYKNVRNDLKSDLKVLFIGTPCQIAGLKAYLKKDYSNLFLIDLCCHGVPSQKYLTDHVKYISNKFHLYTAGCKVSFRQKVRPYNHGKTYLKYGFFLHKDNKIIYSKDFPNDYYIAGFISGLFFRENCFSCQYACRERVSDITLADHWGMGVSENIEMDVNKGLSTILVNTDHGKNLFEGIKNNIVYEKRSWQESLDGNGQFINPSRKPLSYDNFQITYRNYGYLYACKKYVDEYINRHKVNRVIICIKNRLRKIPFVVKLYNNIKKYI